MQDEYFSTLNKNLKKIKKYQKKLDLRNSDNKTLGNINEWIYDNYYVLVERCNFVNILSKTKSIKRISVKRKIHLNQLLLDLLLEKDFIFDTIFIYEQLALYQEKNSDYFSYAEIHFTIISLTNILTNALVEIIKEESMKLSLKIYFEKNALKLEKKLRKNPTADLSKYFDFSLDKITDPDYVLELNYQFKKIGKITGYLFVRLNDILEKERNTHFNILIKKANEQNGRNIFLISNIFRTLKQIEKMKLEQLYKNISFAEKILINEKANIYSKMYDYSKASYRSKITSISKKLKTSEYEFTKQVIEEAKDKHIGNTLFKKINTQLRTRIYVLYIFAVTFLFSIIIGIKIGIELIPILLIPISILVVEITNQIIMIFTNPIGLFKIRFNNIIPEEYTTMVVIPTLVYDKDKIDSVFEKLEIYYLSNKLGNLFFMLSADASEEQTKNVPHDEFIASYGIEKVNELNEKYGENIFNFVYRNRFYNESEDSFIGYERKRGGLHDVNKLLLKKYDEKTKLKYFKCQTLDDFNIKIKYVITLDPDTQLLLNSAKQMIGAMAHPMNQPVLNESRTKVIDGYGILQPKISIDVDVTNKSAYSQLFAGLGGLDIYSVTSFDVYQHFFGEGIFAGKGIYDLEVFDTVLSNAFPKNLILSHDLIESAYARCGFLSDVELYDDYPSDYFKDMKRKHRWNRGDWQILGWLFGKVRNSKNEKVKNEINLLSKWKIFDNVRRSLRSVTLLIILIYGFVFGKEQPIFYFSIVIITIFIPILFHLISKIMHRSKKDLRLKYYLNVFNGILSTIFKSIIILMTLPYDAYIYSDASIRSLYRMFFSKKNLLNWVTAYQVEKQKSEDLTGYFQKFIVNIIFSFLLLLLSVLFNKHALTFSIFISGLWISSPFILYLMSKLHPYENTEKKLSNKQLKKIEDIAFQTWCYFDTLICEENNYLVPDNYQENREHKEDSRTSPTAIGFSLVSIISAIELDFINIKRGNFLLLNIIKAIEKLEKWNGNLFNWYEIKTLDKILPYFVSSVDCGNFVSALYVVKSFANKHDNINLYQRTKKLINRSDFSALYNHNTDVFSIGYNYEDKTLWPYHYNFFASEARLTSFVAIAKGDVPFKHWFCLNKNLTKYKTHKGLLSWSGTAFEYFTPLIFMKTQKNTLLDETYHFVVEVEKAFINGIDKNLPWGISESSYNKFDDSENYKYKAFGIPYLKLQDTKEYPIVISPYSSLMAISIDQSSVYENILKLEKFGLYGKFGFYDAYDHQDEAVVKNYYAHHQGMTLASLANFLKDEVISSYFDSNKEIKSIEILSHEKTLIDILIDKQMNKAKSNKSSKDNAFNDIIKYDILTKKDEYTVLSNSHYSTILTDKGLGYSKFRNVTINRYNKSTERPEGLFVFIKRLDTKKVWSNTYYPIHNDVKEYKAVFASDLVKYTREDDDLITITKIAVTKDHFSEIRKIKVTNNTNHDVDLELTTYSELIMCSDDEDINHRVFNSMSIYSELHEKTQSLIFSRNSKVENDTTYYVVHRMFEARNDSGEFQYETSRFNFIGRNRSIYNPAALKRKKLTNTVGAVLDPIMSIRKTLNVKSGKSAAVYIVTGFGKSKEQVLDIVNRYYDHHNCKKAFDLTSNYNNTCMTLADLNGEQLKTYSEAIKNIYFNRKKDPIKLLNNTFSQPDLWSFGISGNIPIITIDISYLNDVSFIEDALKLYQVFLRETLYIDLIIIQKIDSKYDNSEYEKIRYAIDYLIYKITSYDFFDESMISIKIIKNTDMSETQLNFIKFLASATFDASLSSSFTEQLNTQIKPIDLKVTEELEQLPHSYLDYTDELTFNNGYGGFSKDGKEYTIYDVDTPRPWSNVISGKQIGTVVTASGGGYSYALNSREYKLTAWTNDMTEDPITEKLIINNQLFVPQITKHGFGYTTFECSNTNLNVLVTIFCDQNIPKKYINIELTNKLNSIQTFNIDCVMKLVLGVAVEKTYGFLYSKFENNVLYIENKYSTNFKNVKAYITSTEIIHGHKDNSISIQKNIEAREKSNFSITIGALQPTCDLTIYNNNSILNSKKINDNFWNNKLSTIQVKTKDESFNYMVNGWLLYQTYSSRLYGKTGLYQVGGAIGFRDQLQDVLGILYSDPNYAKTQILIHAEHQFIEGDVLHWWHEVSNAGSRTRFSDDYLWLVYVTYEYIKVTGDYSILDDKARFVSAPMLNIDQSETYTTFSYVNKKQSLYKHMKLCVNKALSQMGNHGLPLMGSGDWNDGMNKVGEKGKGESIFVGFFLVDVLNKYSELATYKKENDFSKLCISKANILTENLHNNAWDGNWYLRAYFDNGEPLGSINNEECKIDLLSQSWSILSGVATLEQKEKIFESVEEHLVDSENKLIKLLTPPFKNSSNDPGYIKDYMTGVRENGGQYTHAASWYLFALLKDKKYDLAFKYFQMINPINRTKNIKDVKKYKVEPYVIPADIYSNEDNPGQGGWTWYTGSASWFYKLAVEGILGFNKVGNKLTINPSTPNSFGEYEIKYKYLNTTYEITVVKNNKIKKMKLEIDGKLIDNNIIELSDDKKNHIVKVSYNRKK